MVAESSASLGGQSEARIVRAVPRRGFYVRDLPGAPGPDAWRKVCAEGAHDQTNIRNQGDER
jgi:hypothetical protein